MFVSYCRRFVSLHSTAADTRFLAHCEVHDRGDAAELLSEFFGARLDEIDRELGVANVVEPEEIEILRYGFERDEDHIYGEIWVRNRSLVGRTEPGSVLERVGHFLDRVGKSVEALPHNARLDWEIPLPFKPARFTPTVSQLFRIPLDWEEEGRLHRLRLMDEPVAEGKHWPDYLALGLNETHVPELIRICTEFDFDVVHHKLGNSAGVFHAVRALGRIASPEAVRFLLNGLGVDHEERHRSSMVDFDFFREELERTLALLGGPVLEPLVRILNDANASEWTREVAAHVLQMLATIHPEHRARVVSVLIDAVEQTGDAENQLVTTCAYSLVEMRAVEAADAIRRGFEEERIDPSYFGDWERARRKLGLSQ